MGTAGLSLGGALAHLAMERSNGLIQKEFIMNPFFGVSVPVLDREVSDCSQDLESCKNGMFLWLNIIY